MSDAETTAAPQAPTATGYINLTLCQGKAIVERIERERPGANGDPRAFALELFAAGWTNCAINADYSDTYADELSPTADRPQDDQVLANLGGQLHALISGLIAVSSQGGRVDLTVEAERALEYHFRLSGALPPDTSFRWWFLKTLPAPVVVGYGSAKLTPFAPFTVVDPQLAELARIINAPSENDRHE